MFDLEVLQDLQNLELNKQDKTDNNLNTTDKTIVGAINEVLSSGGGSGTVKSVNSVTPDVNGNVELTKNNIGLSNVDNTSDLDKPVSTAQATALDEKVDKVEGLGLSAFNFDSTYKTKLDNIEAGAQVNVQADWLETLETAMSFIKNKPTALSQFLNDLSVYYTKTEINSMLSGLNTLTFEIVPTLPTEDIDTKKVYLILKAGAVGDDIYTEHMYINGNWEILGDTSVDLSQYYTKTEADDLFVVKEVGKGLSTNDYTTNEKTKLGGIEVGAEVNVQADWDETNNLSDSYVKNKPTNVSQFANDVGYLKKDGSITLNADYVPTSEYGLVNKIYVDNQLKNAVDLPPLQIYFTGTSSLGLTKPVADVTVPITLAGETPTITAFSTALEFDGFASPKSTYFGIVYFSNLLTNQVYTINAKWEIKNTQIFNQSQQFTPTTETALFRFDVSNVDITENLPYVTGDLGVLTLTISKTGGATNILNIITDVSENQYSSLNRNGYNIFTGDVLEINPDGTYKTQQQINYELRTGIETHSHNTNQIGTNGIADGAVTAVKLAQEVIDLIGSGGGGGGSVNVFDNFIHSGRKMTANGADITLSAGRELIDGSVINRVENTITIPARSTNLIADKKDGTTALVPATYPTSYIDDNTVGFWVFNTTGNIVNSAVGVSSIAVANDLVPSGGITSVDGWADYATKLDGTSGYYTSQNSTGIPIGVSAREFSIMFTLNSINNTNNHILSYGATSGINGVQLFFKATGLLYTGNMGTEYNTNYTLEIGKTYKVTWKYTGTVLYIYVNGTQIYTGNISFNTIASTITIGNYVSGTFCAPITLHYLEVRNAPRTDELTAQIANKLCLPCAYTSGYPSNADITTSANAISSGDNDVYVKGNAFDKNTGTWWNSAENSLNQNGVSYIGNLFGESVKISNATIQQYVASAHRITSAKLQYTTDNGASWVTIDTYPLSPTASIEEFSFIPVTCNGMRWLANSNVGTNGLSWVVYEATFVTDNTGSVRKNITEILPADSVSLGIVRGDTTGVIMYNDSEYQYGRREGAYGGNRRVFLGWKAFSGNVILTWDNPFGTNKLKLQAVWAQDIKGTNERDCVSYFITTAPYGVTTGSHNVTPSSRIVVRCFTNVVWFNDAWQTSGYIGVYAEVLE